MESSAQSAVSYATGVLFRFVDVNLFKAVLGPIILTQFLFFNYQYRGSFLIHWCRFFYL